VEDREFVAQVELTSILEQITEAVVADRPLGPKALIRSIHSAVKKAESKIFARSVRDFEQFVANLPVSGFPPGARFNFARPYLNGTEDELFSGGSEVLVSPHNYQYFLKLVNQSSQTTHSMADWPLAPRLHLTGNYEPILRLLEALPSDVDVAKYGVTHAVPFNGVLLPVTVGKSTDDPVKRGELSTYIHHAREKLRALNPNSHQAQVAKHRSGRKINVPRQEATDSEAVLPMIPFAAVDTSMTSPATKQVGNSATPSPEERTQGQLTDLRTIDLSGQAENVIRTLEQLNRPGGIQCLPKDFAQMGITYCITGPNNKVVDLLPHGRTIPVPMRDLKFYISFAKTALQRCPGPGYNAGEEALKNLLYLLENRSVSASELSQLQLSFAASYGEEQVVPLIPDGEKIPVTTSSLDEYILLLRYQLKTWNEVAAARSNRFAMTPSPPTTESDRPEIVSPHATVDQLKAKPARTRASLPAALLTNPELRGITDDEYAPIRSIPVEPLTIEEARFWRHLKALEKVATGESSMTDDQIAQMKLKFSFRIGNREIELAPEGALRGVVRSNIVEFCNAARAKRAVIHLAFLEKQEVEQQSKTPETIAWARSASESVTDVQRREIEAFAASLPRYTADSITEESWNALNVTYSIPVQGMVIELIPNGKSTRVQYKDRKKFQEMAQAKIEQLLGPPEITGLYSPKHFSEDIFEPPQPITIKSPNNLHASRSSSIEILSSCLACRLRHPLVLKQNQGNRNNPIILSSQVTNSTARVYPASWKPIPQLAFRREKESESIIH
jgi:hypothetical protein